MKSDLQGDMNIICDIWLGDQFYILQRDRLLIGGVLVLTNYIVIRANNTFCLTTPSQSLIFDLALKPKYCQ